MALCRDWKGGDRGEDPIPKKTQQGLLASKHVGIYRKLCRKQNKRVNFS